MLYLCIEFKILIMETTMEKNLKLDYTTIRSTVEVTNHRLNGFEKLIKNIKRFSKYLKLPEPCVKELGTKTYYAVKRYTKFVNSDVEYILDNDTISTNFDEVKSAAKNKDIIVDEEVNVFSLEIVEEIIPDNEWTILGVIDHVDGIVKAAPNHVVPVDLIPKNLEDSCDCDHCNTKRRRNKTIYVRNTDNGEVKRVGGSCIKYYLGYDYQRVLGFITELNNLFVDYNFGGTADFNDGFNRYFYGGYDDDIIGVDEAVKYFFWTVNNVGYMSKAGAAAINQKMEENGDYGSKRSTSEDLEIEIRFMHSPVSGRTINNQKEYDDKMFALENFYRISKEYTDEYFEIMKKFIEERVHENTFLVNSKIFFENGTVKIKNLRFIFGACSMYYGLKLAEERRNAVKKEEQVSKHVGTVGEKMNLYNLKIVNISGFEGGYGWTNVYKLKDENGNIFTKFGKLNEKFITPDSEIDELAIGAILSFCTDIKKHDEYRGVKQTTIGRISKLK